MEGMNAFLADFAHMQGSGEEPSPQDETGMRFTIVRFAPGWEDPLYAVDTADIVVVLDGELVYAVDSGEEMVVGHGDVVIQNGVSKAWKNRSGKPAMIAAAVLGSRVDRSSARPS